MNKSPLLRNISSIFKKISMNKEESKIQLEAKKQLLAKRELINKEESEANNVEITIKNQLKAKKTNTRNSTKD